MERAMTEEENKPLTIEQQKLFTDILDLFAYETIANIFIALLEHNPQFKNSDPQSQIFIDHLQEFLDYVQCDS